MQSVNRCDGGNMSATAVTSAARKPIPWKGLVSGAVALLLMLGVHAVTMISFLDSVVVVIVSVAAVWWIAARDRLPRWLDRLSLSSFAIALLARLIEGPRWQLVMWQLVAVVVATFAGLRMWRPGRSIKLTRILGRTVLVITLLIGSLALLMEWVPALPEPTGEFAVGSQVFHWSDPSRAETLTADASDNREVIAQAWYPSDSADGPPTKYVGTGVAASLMDGVPKAVFEYYDDTDTHSTDLSALSGDRTKWPVLLFSPGLSVARQSYTALCVELASRGYVVVAMSHPYDSPATQLLDGDVVTKGDASGAGAKEDQIDLRAVDSTFVLDQLHQLAKAEPDSPLIGHLDLDHVGIFGHSFGGATAVQAVASDTRFLAGLNIDGSLFRDDIPELDRPFLWLQSDGASGSVSDRDALLDGLRAGGELVKIEGSVHQSFSDHAAYFTPLGRQIVGRIPMIGFGTLSTDDMAPMTADVITAFFGPILNGAANGDLDEVARRYPSVTLERTVESR
jgi:dienelactone hydrolase